jgi:hypothetical protein
MYLLVLVVFGNLIAQIIKTYQIRKKVWLCFLLLRTIDSQIREDDLEEDDHSGTEWAVSTDSLPISGSFGQATLFDTILIRF